MKIVGRNSKPLSDHEFRLLKNWLRKIILISLKKRYVLDKKEAARTCIHRKSFGICGLLKPQASQNSRLTLAMAPRDLHWMRLTKSLQKKV